MTIALFPGLGSGSGSSLPLPVLITSGVATLVASVVSALSIYLHLKNYRKPILQRMVIRIMLMVPLYAISSLISLFSLQAAFFIDVVRDIYEAFVIYCFFDLLIAYLGGERSLLIKLHGRPPKYPAFPASLFSREIDVSDPYTFLFLKRGVLQYVQVKPIIAVVTIILKALDKYHEGDFRLDSGYLYISIVYNTSICMALYCLAIFWMCVNDDLKPFRPMPKFLCVKGILFFSFWQSILISILVSAGAIKKLGPYTDKEHIALGLTDCLICLEMPFFAIAHQYAFSSSDFVNPNAMSVARLRIYYAFRDAFGLKDVVEDSKATLRGEGMDYREFEPSEGYMHQGAGRDRRIRAGLRYSQGGKKKYWLPQPTRDTRPPGAAERRFNKAIENITGRDDQGEEVYAPLLPDQARSVVHLAPDLQSPTEDQGLLFERDDSEDDGFDLPFGEIDPADEELFIHSKKYLFGDYNYPCVDVSNEAARIRVWEEEERILRDERAAYFSPIVGPQRTFSRSGPGQGYGAVGQFQRSGGRPRYDSDASDGTRDKGKGRQKGVSPMRQVVVDKELDRTPDMSAGELKLKWTKANTDPPAPSRIRKLSSQGNPSSRRSTPSTSSPGSPATSSPKTRPPPSPRRDKATSPLPPDAVDLVVEEPHDANESPERQRDPGQGLKKVYRRGYVVHGTEGDVEVESPSTVRPGAGESKYTIDDVDEAIAVEDAAVEELTETVAQTPPAHARIFIDRYSAVDENPWA